MSYGEVIKYEKQDMIGVVTIDNVMNGNAIGEKFFQEMEEIQAEILEDKELRVVILAAEGKMFTVGLDLNYLQTANSEKIKSVLGKYQRLYSFWQELPIPVIAGVQGMCIGSGVELILACDMRIASMDAKFSLPEARLGLAPDMGGTTRLTKLIGPGRAKAMLFTGQQIKAKEAFGMGLVEMMVPFEALRGTLFEVAREITKLPPSAMRFVKKGVNLAVDSPVAAGLLFEEAQSTYCCGTEDLREGIAAFLEKRPAVFTGK